MIQFEVIGHPSPQGSKHAFVVQGKARMKDMGGMKAVAWRDSVASAAAGLALEHGQLTGPLKLTVVFRFPMPKSRTKAAHTAGWGWKDTAPDTDKLLRSLGDAMQAGGLISDDARICVTSASKLEVSGGWTGAEITLTPLGRYPGRAMTPEAHADRAQPSLLAEVSA
jgi:Holliday junction resolvase RusA-like endonuclease